MSDVNGNIEIGKNCIKYGDEVLKISSISRVWIFRFQNREKKAYEDAKRSYEDAKNRFEAEQAREKKKKTRNYVIVAIVLFFISLYLLSSSIMEGIAPLIVAGIFGYMAYRTASKSIEYQRSPPQKGSFPDKYGLNIEMNSGYSVVFTAIGSDGVQALRILQNEITDADTQQEITIFNMHDNRISVENNDGIISIGDNTKNKIEEKELLKI